MPERRCTQYECMRVLHLEENGGVTIAHLSDLIKHIELILGVKLRLLRTMRQQIEEIQHQMPISGEKQSTRQLGHALNETICVGVWDAGDGEVGCAGPDSRASGTAD